MMTILSLFDYSGAWCRAFERLGCEAILAIERGLFVWSPPLYSSRASATRRSPLVRCS